MKMILRGMLLTCILFTLTGCGGISGQWTLDSIEPDSAQKAFPIAKLCLHKDHTYVAGMGCGSNMNGTWGVRCRRQVVNLHHTQGHQAHVRSSFVRQKAATF